MTTAINPCMLCHAMDNSSAIHTDTSPQTQEELMLIAIVQQARDSAAQGQSTMQCYCDEADNPQSGINIACHQIWNPLLLSSVAAEGIDSLYLEGLTACSDCPKAFSNESMQQIISDYEILHQAMLTKLEVIQGSITPNLKHEEEEVDKKEPDRRAFFRHVIPSLAKHAADTITQNMNETGSSVQQSLLKDTRPLPLMNKLFLHALPKLQVTHTPVPAMASTALGNIQAEQTCTACGDCVTTCPSQALNLKPFGKNFILEFQAYACTGCNICVETCPEQAIQALPSISLPALLVEKARPLVMVYSSQ